MAKARGSMETATTLTHVAALLQIIFTLLGFVALIGVGIFASLSARFAFVGTVGAIGILLGIVWSWMDYNVIYQRVKSGRYSGVADTMLVVGILQLFLGGSIPGILIIIAWAVARG